MILIFIYNYILNYFSNISLLLGLYRLGKRKQRKMAFFTYVYGLFQQYYYTMFKYYRNIVNKILELAFRIDIMQNKQEITEKQVSLIFSDTFIFLNALY